MLSPSQSIGVIMDLHIEQGLQIDRDLKELRKKLFVKSTKNVIRQTEKVWQRLTDARKSEK